MCLVGFMLHSCWRLVAREIGWSDNDVSCSSHNVVLLLVVVLCEIVVIVVVGVNIDDTDTYDGCL